MRSPLSLRSWNGSLPQTGYFAPCITVSQVSVSLRKLKGKGFAECENERIGSHVIREPAAILWGVSFFFFLVVQVRGRMTVSSDIFLTF